MYGRISSISRNSHRPNERAPSAVSHPHFQLFQAPSPPFLLWRLKLVIVNKVKLEVWRCTRRRSKQNRRREASKQSRECVTLTVVPDLFEVDFICKLWWLLVVDSHPLKVTSLRESLCKSLVSAFNAAAISFFSQPAIPGRARPHRWRL